MSGGCPTDERLDRLLAIAAQLPDVAFEIAGSIDTAFPAGNALIDQAHARANVRVLGQVARDHMPAVYAGATCLLCTSDYEGFPNTFLEAWAQGVPVVSTVDPDGLIASERLGCTNTTDAGLAGHIEHLAAAPEEHGAIGRRAREYVERHHSPASALAAFEQTFRDVIAGASPR